MSESANQILVRAFLGAWDRRDLEAMIALMHEDAIYHNIPVDPLHGHAAIREFCAPFFQRANAVNFEILAIGDAGPDRVLTERVDRFALGEKRVAIPVMGAFDIKNGKITYWRDYYDKAQTDAQMT